jgi:G3E family GTPase
MKIAKVVTVLDIELWEARECFGPIFFKQLQLADLILLNKIDIVEEHITLQFLNEIHESMPHSQVIPTIHCAVDPEIVMDGRPLGPKLADFTDISHYQGDRESPYGALNPVSFTFQTGDAIDEACFRTFTEKLPWALFRMKGPVRFPDRTILVNYAGGKNEWTRWSDGDETCLVFIGWNLEAGDILKNIEQCIVP